MEDTMSLAEIGHWLETNTVNVARRMVGAMAKAERRSILLHSCVARWSSIVDELREIEKALKSVEREIHHA